MRIPKILLIPLSVISNFVACGQKPEKSQNELLKEVIEQERISQEKAKSGNKNPRIEIITDAGKVTQLRTEVQAKLAAAQKAKGAIKKSIGERYKMGDKSVIPEIVQVLKGNNQQQKKEVYLSLEKRYDDPESYTITEKELTELLFQDIDNPTYEKEAVQLAGLNKVPGYEERMAARLLSGKSTDKARIVFWLSKKGNKVALDHITNLIKENKIQPKELDQVLYGLEEFGQNGNSDVQKTVGELALAIYNKKLVTEAQFEELKGYAFGSGSAETLLACLFKYGDERVISIAQDIMKRKIRIEGPVQALIRLEGAKHVDKVYNT